LRDSNICVHFGHLCKLVVWHEQVRLSMMPSAGAVT